MSTRTYNKPRSTRSLAGVAPSNCRESLNLDEFSYISWEAELDTLLQPLVMTDLGSGSQGINDYVYYPFLAFSHFTDDYLTIQHPGVAVVLLLVLHVYGV